MASHPPLAPAAILDTSDRATVATPLFKAHKVWLVKIMPLLDEKQDFSYDHEEVCFCWLTSKFEPVMSIKTLDMAIASILVLRGFSNLGQGVKTFKLLDHFCFRNFRGCVNWSSKFQMCSPRNILLPRTWLILSNLNQKSAFNELCARYCLLFPLQFWRYNHLVMGWWECVRKQILKS